MGYLNSPCLRANAGLEPQLRPLSAFADRGDRAICRKVDLPAIKSAVMHCDAGSGTPFGLAVPRSREQAE